MKVLVTSEDGTVLRNLSAPRAREEYVALLEMHGYSAWNLMDFSVPTLALMLHDLDEMGLT